MNDAKTIDNETLLGEIRTLLSQGKRVKLRAKGDSMWPFIHGIEDTLLLAPAENLRKGDVVLARIDGERFVVHRIIQMTGDSITLMGDGNLYQTEECSRSDIYGTVENIIRGGKEHHIKAPDARLRATVWRYLLPLRRMKFRISNRFKRK